MRRWRRSHRGRAAPSTRRSRSRRGAARTRRTRSRRAVGGSGSVTPASSSSGSRLRRHVADRELGRWECRARRASSRRAACRRAAPSRSRAPRTDRDGTASRRSCRGCASGGARRGRAPRGGSGTARRPRPKTRCRAGASSRRLSQRLVVDSADTRARPIRLRSIRWSGIAIAEVHHRHQRLPAGEHARVLERGEQIERFGRPCAGRDR